VSFGTTPSPMSPDSSHPRDRRCRFRRVACLLPFVALFAVGCTSGEVQSTIPPSVENLRSVRDGYFEARRALERPPRSKEELVPYLKKFGDPAQLLRSPDDGEDFVIVYGTDPMAAESMSYVWAYERHGKDGSRWIIRNRHVQRIANDKLAKLPFPPGHKSGI
jgi:hypothetical protein